MIAYDSGTAAGWILLSWALQNSGHSAQAQAAAQTAVAKAPLSQAALDNYATFLVRAQAYNQAIALCDKAVRLAPNRTRSHVLRGMALYAQGRNVDAIEEFSRVAELSPRDAAAWCMLGEVYHNTNNRVLSERAYRQALLIDPGDIDAQSGLGVAFSPPF
jgi:Flp pilus assembly protein TadD